MNQTVLPIRTTASFVRLHSDAELEAMMADLESDLVERKESLQGDSPRRIREAVCAFANELPDRRRSGVVFVGASDDGRTVGLPITDELLLQLADVKTDGSIVPPPTLTVGKRILFRQPVPIVAAQPSDTPRTNGDESGFASGLAEPSQALRTRGC